MRLRDALPGRRLCAGLRVYRTTIAGCWCLGLEVYTDLSWREVGLLLGHHALYLHLDGGLSRSHGPWPPQGIGGRDA